MTDQILISQSELGTKPSNTSTAKHLTPRLYHGYLVTVGKSAHLCCWLSALDLGKIVKKIFFKYIYTSSF